MAAYLNALKIILLPLKSTKIRVVGDFKNFIIKFKSIFSIRTL